MAHLLRPSAAAVAMLGWLAAQPVTAQTLTESLAAAYSTNPSLNVDRAQLRAVDENIAIARSGNRPVIQGTFDYLNATTRTNFSGVVRNPATGDLSRGNDATDGVARSTFRVRLTQPLFEGFQTRNAIRGAEAAVRAGRSNLESTEQQVLLAAAVSFLDILQNGQIVGLRQNDVEFLGEQVRAAQDRFEVGEGTRTDVSQAEARRAQAQTSLNFAVANLAAAQADYRQVTGLTARNLRDNYNVERLLPRSLEAAFDIAQNNHPDIISALHDVDVNLFNVAELSGRALPTVNAFVEGSTTLEPSTQVDRTDNAQIGLNVTVPIYQGGLVSAQVRQAKENLGAARIQVDVARDVIRQRVATSWSAFQASVRSIFNAQTGVFSAQLALQGVVEEQRVGQRTTLDVLDAQRELIVAQITLAQAARNRDANAFQLLADIGQLNARRLGLSVNEYQPAEHTDAVRGKWYGFRTPDGR